MVLLTSASVDCGGDSSRTPAGDGRLRSEVPHATISLNLLLEFPLASLPRAAEASGIDREGLPRSAGVAMEPAPDTLPRVTEGDDTT